MPGLSIGGGVTWSFQTIEEELALGSAFLLNGVVTGDVNDIDIHIDTQNYNTWGWNAGVLFEPTTRWALGASVSSGRTYRTTGELEASFAEGNPLAEFVVEDTVTDDDVTVVIRMPLVARLGFAYRPSDALELELATVYEGWSVAQETLITDIDLTLTTSTDELLVTEDVVLPLGFNDAFSVRFGGAFDLNDHLTLRGGGFWANSAIPTSTLNVSVVDGPKFGTGAGFTYTMGERFDLDVGFMKIFIQDQKITDSSLELALLGIDLTSLDEAGIVSGDNIGNGMMKSNATLAAVGLHMAFGRGSSASATEAAPAPDERDDPR
jgi:long-subunit fatty acid transport protein